MIAMNTADLKKIEQTLQSGHFLFCAYDNMVLAFEV